MTGEFIKNFVIYLLVINVVTFFVMGIDKWKAKRGSWRIQESALFTFVLFGGGIGGIMGMYFFHHKTKKLKFKFGFPAITILEIAMLVYIFMNI